MTAHFKGRCYRMSKKQKQAGAELCQAQDLLDLPAEAKLILKVVNPILVVLEKACLAHLQLFRLSSIEVVFHGGRLIFVKQKSIVLN